MRVRQLSVFVAPLALTLLVCVSAFVRGDEGAPKPQAKATRVAEPASHAATYIHVRNGTPRALNFTLYVECAAGGTGKFDRQIKLAPGDTAVWKLAAEHRVLTTKVEGAVYYRVGLVGRDANSGREHRWGLVGGAGMYGKERQAVDETTAKSSRHIHVQPIGDI